MFSLTGIFFLSILGALFFMSILKHPFFGIIGYIIIYNISPAGQYWGRPLLYMGVRYNVLMTAALALGFLLNSKKIDFRAKLHSQEVLFWLLVLVVWLSAFWGLPGAGLEAFHVKLAKVGFFLWFLVRIVDTLDKYEAVIWTLILLGLYLGYAAFHVDTSSFGRIDVGIGGPDFKEGNFLAAHFSMLFPFIAVMLLLTKKLWVRLLTALAGVLTVNAMVLCRSRGAFLAVAAGVVAALAVAPAKYRKKIIGLLVVGMIGALFLVDQGFIDRMGRINADITNLEEQDSSAAGRILAWTAAVDMAQDHPLGIGQGNFSRYVGDYQPEIPGKDTHSTYLRALAELGFPGLFLIGAMIWNAFGMLLRLKRRIAAHDLPHDLLLHVYAQGVALVIFLTAGLFVTETYIEEFYWLLMFPVLLERVVAGQMRERGLVDDGMVARQREIAGLFEGESAR